jgi:hypothetical protein
MATNIRFHYLYRDSGNYKKFGFKDFSNPTNLSIGEIQAELSKKLIDGMYFYPENVGIQKFRFHKYCDDNSWYEMQNLELLSSGKPKETIQDFLDRFLPPAFRKTVTKKE